MKRLTLMVLLLLAAYTQFGYAESKSSIWHPKVTLLGIERVNQSESAGDELYLAITVYPSKGRPRHYYYPKQPLHWPSAHVEKIKPTRIWDRRIPVGEGATVIFALVERDAPPWNVDDLVGEIELKLKSSSSGQSSDWSILTRGSTGSIEDFQGDSSKKIALLKGHGGEYKLILGLD